MKCPLCDSTETGSFLMKKANRSYHHCRNCDLVFLDPKYYVSNEDEKKRYLKHTNSLNDAKYVKMLDEFIDSCITPFVNKKQNMLDYGCGHTPVLSKLLEKRGYDVENYDPYFYPKFPDHTFDCIMSTEVIEHFKDAKKEMGKMLALLKPKGMLTIMTQLRELNISELEKWHYIHDETHTSFYSRKTMEYISKEFNLAILQLQKNKVVLKKNY